MTPEQAALLREPFPPSVIGKLPRVTCRRCRDLRGICDQHRPVNCRVCRNTAISEAHIHLDYCGHAAVTDRLLKLDPNWSWEPYGIDDRGLPATQGNTLWIKLTVFGKTVPGFGDGASMKECIGDAIRNAAMRLGVALDLWAKEDLGVVRAGDQTPAPAIAASAEEMVARDPLQPPLVEGMLERVAGPGVARDPAFETGDDAKMWADLGAAFKDSGMDKAGRLAYSQEIIGRSIKSATEMTAAEARKVLEELTKWQKTG